ncbi:hypothetical protein ITJ38_13335 [Agreia pratensis]|uniref:hypothetical protein n=1 Tax=Agreia pratensis TaxID=150121 RepID=UPI00188A27B8|nr:hypothetical protein [Agreia pratensis]MBF4635392.1 hypothetical protein [Agreia pratensis]
MSDNTLPPVPQGASSVPPVPPIPSVPVPPMSAPPVPQAQNYPVQPQFQFAQPQPQPVQPQPRPQQSARRSRKGLIIGISIAAAVVILGGAGLAVAGASISSSVAPDTQVKTFLQDLVDGRAESALEVMGEKPSGLLTDDAYNASSNHITGFSVGKAKTTGDTATVTAKITQGGTSYTQEFELEKAGKTFVVFDVWQLQPLPLGAVDVQVQGPDGLAVQVDGNTVEDADESGLRAFPGDYEVSVVDDSDLFDAAPATANVVGLSDAAAGSIATAAVTTTLTEAGTAAARAAVDAYVDGCVAQQSLAPTGCGFQARAQDGVSYSNIRWTLTARPTYSIGDWAGNGWSVSTATAGTLDVVADSVDSAGRSGQSGTSLPNYRPAGTASVVDGAITFSSSALPF